MPGNYGDLKDFLPDKDFIGAYIALLLASPCYQALLGETKLSCSSLYTPAQ